MKHGKREHKARGSGRGTGSTGRETKVQRRRVKDDGRESFRGERKVKCEARGNVNEGRALGQVRDDDPRQAENKVKDESSYQDFRTMNKIDTKNAR